MINEGEPMLIDRQDYHVILRYIEDEARESRPISESLKNVLFRMSTDTLMMLDEKMLFEEYKDYVYARFCVLMVLSRRNIHIGRHALPRLNDYEKLMEDGDNEE